MSSEYTTPDGRTFVVLDDFELRASARDAWRRQQVADLILDQKLSAMPRPAPVRPAPPLRFVTGDLFATQPAQGQAEGGGSSRANSEGGRSPNPPHANSGRRASR